MVEGEREPRATQDDQRWTNEHVEEGFDVDGAADRAHLLSVDTRFAVARALYAFFGEAIVASTRSERRLYPLVRTLGEAVGRREGVEQRIAEKEYLLTEITAVDRPAVGSRAWLLGAALVGGFVLTAVGGLGVVFGIVVAGVAPTTFFAPGGRLVVGLFGAGVATLVGAALVLDRSGP